MRYLFSLTALLLAGQLCRARVDAGAITGSVKDASGAVVVGANVKITETDTGITLTLATNGDGFYSAPALHVGKYDVSATAAGFTVENRKDIELRVQDRINADFTLILLKTNGI